MHQSSLEKMALFKEKYLKAKINRRIRIVDIGSQDVNGSYKQIFEESQWEYIGMDTSRGNNVDIVIDDPYSWKQLKNSSVDVVISGQAFEHIEFPWLTMLEINRILKPGGLCCIIAPSGGFEHRYPIDCWRFYPDGFTVLAKLAMIDVLEVYVQKESGAYSDGSDQWKDCVLIGMKCRDSAMVMIKRRLTYQLLRYLLE